MAHILVVDDDRDFLNLSEVVLKRGKHEITTAKSISESIHYLGAKIFDLILIDLHMSESDGLTFFKIINQLPDFSYSKLAILTASTRPHDIKKASELGVKNYVVKASSPEEYLQKVEDVLEASDSDKIQVK
jgi:CheY-like chemotaxis protein